MPEGLDDFEATLFLRVRNDDVLVEAGGGDVAAVSRVRHAAYLRRM